APVVLDVVAAQGGYVVDIEPMTLALAANRLGAGRVRKGDAIDHSVGFEIVRAVGDPVRPGSVLARVHARTAAAAEEARAVVRGAVAIGGEAVQARGVILDRFASDDG